MSATINDGGTAFPVLERGGQGLELSSSGMTLRDYFAAKAMQAICEEVIRYGDFDTCARNAYKMADAMLAARSA